MNENGEDPMRARYDKELAAKNTLAALGTQVNELMLICVKAGELMAGDPSFPKGAVKAFTSVLFGLLGVVKDLREAQEHLAVNSRQNGENIV